ncbi:MAG: type II toxin-antitoxin system VapC family toxin [Alphaproteobacteria bacterium]|nr:type II toxin-antitoxin system VapC family toxin [Alphaproteobacteria bacterium]
MPYLDTSVLVPLVVPEPASTALEDWFDREMRDGRDFVISDWCLTEFASALGMKQRERRLSRVDGERAAALMKTIAKDVFRIVLPNRADYSLATDYLGRVSLGLRAGDALHLAIAARAEAGPIVSLDRKMLRAARALGHATVHPMG